MAYLRPLPSPPHNTDYIESDFIRLILDTGKILQSGCGYPFLLGAVYAQLRGAKGTAPRSFYLDKD